MNCLHIICLRFCFIIHHRISDCAPEDVSKALARTLEDLQLDYIDLYLVWFLISIPVFKCDAEARDDCMKI
jgi:diketogulonate reductase-like aldo/keto reductase